MFAIMVILTNQGWMDIMFDHIRALDGNIYVSFFFILVLIIGNFLLLNLFLAILINNFGESASKLEQQKSKQKSVFSMKKILSSFSFRMRKKIAPVSV